MSKKPKDIISMVLFIGIFVAICIISIISVKQLNRSTIATNSDGDLQNVGKETVFVVENGLEIEP